MSWKSHLDLIVCRRIRPIRCGAIVCLPFEIDMLGCLFNPVGPRRDDWDYVLRWPRLAGWLRRPLMMSRRTPCAAAQRQTDWCVPYARRWAFRHVHVCALVDIWLKCIWQDGWRAREWSPIYQNVHMRYCARYDHSFPWTHRTCSTFFFYFSSDILSIWDGKALLGCPNGWDSLIFKFSCSKLRSLLLPMVIS